MPLAVTHILVPILLMSLIRDFYNRKKSKGKFSLHYVLIAGLGGVLPDIDIPISFVLYTLGVENWFIHGEFLHSLLFPAVLLLLSLALTTIHKKAKICNIGRHNLKLSVIFLMLAIGVLIHLGLDALFHPSTHSFYPFIVQDYSINLVNYLPESWQFIALPTLDGVLLVIWIVYLELKHKISDFI